MSVLNANLANSGLFFKVPAKTKPQSESFVEILPYGFVSRNYMKYVSGNLESCSISELPGKNRAIIFEDSTIIIETSFGQLIELDKRRRVVLVRVSRSEAEGARRSLGKQELTECFKNTVDRNGNPVVVMPGNIIIRDENTKITIVLPDGTEVFARRAA
ncbi:MAG: hypothetical protein K2X27_23565 [Candidatus Obscuribacterales bacterium]|nr:hypothetical protein [Candidatus Obscuribacterales bacterium]